MSQQDKIALLSQIPDELKRINSWVVWKYENVNNADKPTKPPYNAKTGSKASVTDPSTWCSYSDVIKCLANGGDYNGIGFVFSDRDKYSIIDLDKAEGATLQRQQQIAQEFDSYSEVSPSGYGLHIIVKGKVPTGKRKDCIEVYSNLRYATFTGNVFKNKPIADCQDKLTKLWEELGAEKNVIQSSINEVEKCTDEEIIEQCRSAVNSDKFSKLYAGEWKGSYPSQSEADLALINIIAFYTKNRNQIIRLFRQSKLGKRQKANRSDYVNWMIEKAFDQTLPPIDFDLYNKEIEEKLAQTRKDGEANTKQSSSSDAGLPPANNASPLSSGVGASRPVAQRLEPAAHNGLVASSNLAGPTISFPEGLLGEIASFFYAASPRQVPEIALAASIGLMAGICGRAYNISGTGLNQYIIIIANTGAGKESAASGIDRLMAPVKELCPVASKVIGPAEIASGQALLKFLNKNPCFLSVLGEFGIRLQQMSDPRANSHERAMLRVMLDLYNKSGHKQTISSSIYADAEKNISLTHSPSFSLLAESTPETLYSVLNEDMIAAGLLPRFLMFEYKGKVPYLNNNHEFVIPDNILVSKLTTLVSNAELLMTNKNVCNVGTDNEAGEVLHKFQKYATDQINKVDKEILRQLWNRAHMKVLRLASLVAIGVNYLHPVITKPYVDWAADLVYRDIDSLSVKFELGQIGKSNTEENKQLDTLKNFLKEHRESGLSLASSYDRFRSYCNLNIIPYSYLFIRMEQKGVFINDKRGRKKSIQEAIDVLVSDGSLVKVPHDFFEKHHLKPIIAYKILDI